MIVMSSERNRPPCSRSSRSTVAVLPVSVSAESITPDAVELDAGRVQQHPAAGDHDEAQQRLDDVGVDDVRRPRQQRADRDGDRLAELDPEVGAEPAEVLLVAERPAGSADSVIAARRAARAGRPTSPTRTAMSTSASATHWARKNSSSGSRIWEPMRDHAGDVVAVGQVLRPLAGGGRRGRGRRGTRRIDEHATGSAGVARVPGRAVDHPVADRNRTRNSSTRVIALATRTPAPAVTRSCEDRQPAEQQQVVHQRRTGPPGRAGCRASAAVDQRRRSAGSSTASRPGWPAPRRAAACRPSPVVEEPQRPRC